MQLYKLKGSEVDIDKLKLEAGVVRFSDHLKQILQAKGLLMEHFLYSGNRS